MLDSTAYDLAKVDEQAFYAYAAERLRLLYVGITRARSDLWISWNTGKGKEPSRLALPIVHLQGWLDQQA
ncbi:MAG: hypothetical protein HC915_01695 [Anaerolineae bacterium]|nr:hypothetical protein [Anaerolineae bacterium]